MRDVIGKKGKADKKEKKKATKDKDAPKKAIGAFFWYQNDRREPLKAENPTSSHKELVSVSDQY